LHEVDDCVVVKHYGQHVVKDCGQEEINRMIALACTFGSELNVNVHDMYQQSFCCSSAL
jgi:hypothetical protein